jgi:dTDP-glucose 4,6-dehydratase
MNKVLLLGGGRMIGPPLIKILADDKNEVTVVNRNSPPEVANVKYISGDRSDKNFVNHLREIPFDVVIDLSCYEPEDVLISLEAFSDKVKSYFLMSTGLVYLQDGIYPCSENHLRGENVKEFLYAKKKLETEEIAKTFSNRVNIILLRAPYLVGNPDFMNRLQFISSRLIENKVIYIPGYGNSSYQILSSSEVARAINHLVFKSNTESGFNPFNIGASETINSKGLVKLLAKYLGIKEFNMQSIFVEDVGLSNENFSFTDLVFPFPDQTIILDDQKLKMTGFEYEVDLNKLISEFSKEFTKNQINKSFPSFQAEIRASKLPNKREVLND